MAVIEINVLVSIEDDVIIVGDTYRVSSLVRNAARAGWDLTNFDLDLDITGHNGLGPEFRVRFPGAKEKELRSLIKSVFPS